MNFYVTMTAPKESVPLGTSHQFLFNDFKTLKGVVNRIKRHYPKETFYIYGYTNLYDDDTIKLLKVFKNY